MLNESHELKVAVGFLIAVALVIQVDSQSPCTTPDSKRGLCVPILTCGPIVARLRVSSNRPSPEVAQFIRNSHCGTFSSVIHVCCASAQQATNAALQSEINPNSNANVQLGMAILEACPCGKSFYFGEESIGNGRDANRLKYPWMALLVYTKGSDRTMECGGSLITDRYVLTAAHCIRLRNPRMKLLVSVRLGEHDVNKTVCAGHDVCPPVQEIGIEEAIYHKDFSGTHVSDDIGLIRLASIAIFRINVRPICLPIASKSQEMILHKMTIAGWGLLETGVQANILQEADVPVKHINYCKNIHKLIQFTEKHMCTGGENNIDTCLGDSGGPIFTKIYYRYTYDYYVQYGIMSAGGSVCGSIYPGIGTRVIPHLRWIAGNIR